jgi:hypothetical protein
VGNAKGKLTGPRPRAEWGELFRKYGWSVDLEITGLVNLARGPDPRLSLRALSALREVRARILDGPGGSGAEASAVGEVGGSASGEQTRDHGHGV